MITVVCYDGFVAYFKLTDWDILERLLVWEKVEYIYCTID